jgi:hypothetical protein
MASPHDCVIQPELTAFGPLPVNFQLIPLGLLYAQEFQNPPLESSHHNGRMDRYGRLPGHPSFNSATPPERDPFDDTFAHLQVPLPGNDTFGHNPVLYQGRMPDQYGRLPGHPHYHRSIGPYQDPLNGTYPDLVQVPASELKKLAQTWREETRQKEMAARAEQQLKARPQFTPIRFRVNPEFPSDEVRTLPSPEAKMEEQCTENFKLGKHMPIIAGLVMPITAGKYVPIIDKPSGIPTESDVTRM